MYQRWTVYEGPAVGGERRLPAEFNGVCCPDYTDWSVLDGCVPVHCRSTDVGCICPISNQMRFMLMLCVPSERFPPFLTVPTGVPTVLYRSVRLFQVSVTRCFRPVLPFPLFLLRGRRLRSRYAIVSSVGIGWVRRL